MFVERLRVKVQLVAREGAVPLGVTAEAVHSYAHCLCVRRLALCDCLRLDPRAAPPSPLRRPVSLLIKQRLFLRKAARFALIDLLSLFCTNMFAL